MDNNKMSETTPMKENREKKRRKIITKINAKISRSNKTGNVGTVGLASRNLAPVITIIQTTID